jgi:hypothetical protein
MRPLDDHLETLSAQLAELEAWQAAQEHAADQIKTVKQFRRKLTQGRLNPRAGRTIASAAASDMLTTAGGLPPTKLEDAPPARRSSAAPRHSGRAASDDAGGNDSATGSRSTRTAGDTDEGVVGRACPEATGQHAPFERDDGDPLRNDPADGHDQDHLKHRITPPCRKVPKYQTGRSLALACFRARWPSLILGVA